MTWLHITETEQQADGGYRWLCRCGAAGGDYTDRAWAREAGDAHLSAANSSDPKGCEQHPVANGFCVHCLRVLRGEVPS